MASLASMASLSSTNSMCMPVRGYKHDQSRWNAVNTGRASRQSRQLKVRARGEDAAAGYQLKDGHVVDGPDLSVEVNGIKFPNPYVIGSGPPGTNYAVMKKALEEGWGGVICKTVSDS